MTAHDMLATIEDVIAKAKTGILATVDNTKRPHLRWMTPAVLQGRPGFIYAVTAPFFAKLTQISANTYVEWLIQTPSLKEILSIAGTITVIDNPALKNEIISAIGKHLFVFWKTNPKGDFLALETRIESATFFRPMQGTSETVTFRT
jgi:pyridoxamine 5'-phosphate oxidase